LGEISTGITQTYRRCSEKAQIRRYCRML
jgi:hypothetical protein